MEQLQQWRRQRDLLMLAETSQQERLNLTVRTEITKLKLLIGECVAHAASAEESNNE
jgi:hypothetical protein